MAYFLGFKAIFKNYDNEMWFKGLIYIFEVQLGISTSLGLNVWVLKLSSRSFEGQMWYFRGLWAIYKNVSIEMWFNELNYRS